MNLQEFTTTLNRIASLFYTINEFIGCDIPVDTKKEFEQMQIDTEKEFDVLCQKWIEMKHELVLVLGEPMLKK